MDLLHMDEKRRDRSAVPSFFYELREKCRVSCSLAFYRRVCPLPQTLRQRTADTSCHQTKFPSASCCLPGRCCWSIRSRVRPSSTQEAEQGIWQPFPCLRN